MYSRLALFFCLVFSLLFAQQGAVLHALSHFTNAPNQSQHEKHLPHSPACDKCVAYADIGSAVSSSLLVFSTQKTTTMLAVAVFTLCFSARLRAYLSRAPPRLI